MGRLETLCIAGGNVKWCSFCGKQYGSSSKKINIEKKKSQNRVTGEMFLSSLGSGFCYLRITLLESQLPLNFQKSN